ncbi:MAG: O-antigen ligase family protein [Cyanobacteria bacterium P01_A01_bin.45]
MLGNRLVFYLKTFIKNNLFYFCSAHPDPNLQLLWNISELGIFILPLFPSVGAVTLGLVMIATAVKKYREVINIPINKAFFALSILLIFTCIFAVDKSSAFLGLFNFLPFFLFFAVFSTLFKSVSQLRQIAWILIITSIPIAISGLGQLYSGWSTPKWWFNIFGWAIASGGNPVGRMASVFMYANIFAGYVVIIFTLALGLWLENLYLLKSFYSSNSSFNSNLKLNLSLSKNTVIKRFIFISIAVLLNFISLILTNSRNAWVIALVVCLGYAIFQGWRILVTGVCAIATSVILAAFAPTGIAQLFRKVIPQYFWARLNDQMFSDRPVALMRSTQWNFTWSMTQQRPLTGWGLRNFTSLYESKMGLWLGHPHNLFLMLSAEAGIIASLFFYGLLLWIILNSFRYLKRSKNIYENDKIIFFSYLMVSLCWILFNTVDVSIFDLRLNTLTWFLTAAIFGISRTQEKYINPI